MPSRLASGEARRKVGMSRRVEELTLPEHTTHGRIINIGVSFEKCTETVIECPTSTAPHITTVSTYWALFCMKTSTLDVVYVILINEIIPLCSNSVIFIAKQYSCLL